MNWNIRPDNPRPFRLELRDRAVLALVAEFRYLTSDHIHALAFAGVARRQAQARLRHLWVHRYLDRFFVPVVLTGAGASDRQPARPLYCLARRGAEVVASDTGVSVDRLPHTPSANAAGYATMTHHLVATDLLVAVRGVLGASAATRTEFVLRAAVAAARGAGMAPPFLTPDAAFTLGLPSGRPCSFYVEVVRAGVKSGNATFLRKLDEYARSNRAGVFRRLYGDKHLRAVLIATPTSARAERLRALAGGLAHGRGLFWFTGYGEETSGAVGGVPTTWFTPAAVLDLRWIDSNGAAQSLRSEISNT